MASGVASMGLRRLLDPAGVARRRRRWAMKVSKPPGLSRALNPRVWINHTTDAAAPINNARHTTRNAVPLLIEKSPLHERRFGLALDFQDPDEAPKEGWGRRQGGRRGPPVRPDQSRTRSDDYGGRNRTAARTCWSNGSRG